MPYFLFLGLWLIAVLGYAVGTFFYLYHVIRFGAMTPITRFMIFLHIFVTVVILALSIAYIVTIDWSQSVDVPWETSTDSLVY